MSREKSLPAKLVLKWPLDATSFPCLLPSLEAALVNTTCASTKYERKVPSLEEVRLYSHTAQHETRCQESFHSHAGPLLYVSAATLLLLLHA